jgi:hypothetical protein
LAANTQLERRIHFRPANFRFRMETAHLLRSPRTREGRQDYPAR